MSLSAIEYLRHILDETGYLIERAQGANLGAIYARCDVEACIRA
jgi:predicted phosphoadenosine phosphosulfate sulfurtransferase